MSIQDRFPHIVYSSSIPGLNIICLLNAMQVSATTRHGIQDQVTLIWKTIQDVCDHLARDATGPLIETLVTPVKYASLSLT